MASLARRLVDRYGYRLRYGVNRFVARYSLIPDHAVFDPADFAWTGPSASEWRTIRDEFRAQSGSDRSFRSISDLSPDHAGLNPEDKWHSSVLHGYGIRIDANCRRYARTAEVVERIPGLVSAMFSVLQPGGRLPEHVGVTKGMLTCHLSLDIPDGDCAMSVEGERREWREGEWTVFDDTRRHAAWNMTARPRTVLLVHVERPLHGLGRLLQALFFRGIVASPFVQDFYKGIVRHVEAQPVEAQPGA